MSKTRIAIAYLTENQVGLGPHQLRAVLGSPSKALVAFSAISGIRADRHALEVFVLSVRPGDTPQELAKAFENDPRKDDIRILCYDENENIDFSLFNDGRLLIAIALGARKLQLRELPCNSPGCIIECPQDLFLSLLQILKNEFSIARSTTLKPFVQNQPRSQAERSLFLKKAQFLAHKSDLVAPRSKPTYAPLGLLTLSNPNQTNGEALKGALGYWDDFISQNPASTLPYHNDEDAVLRHLKKWTHVGGQLGRRQAQQLHGSLAPGANLIVRVSKSISSRKSPDIRNKVGAYFRRHARLNEIKAFEGFLGFNDKNLQALLREEWLSATRLYLS